MKLTDLTVSHFQIEDFSSPLWVDKSGPCWLWRGAGRNGSKRTRYGRVEIKRNGKTYSIGAHKLSYLIHRGEVKEGEFVCHRCDNPLCVKPDHLFTGTSVDNMHDAMSKGRLAHGESHVNAKLTDAVVLRIRELNEAGMSQEEIALEVGVAQSTISRVLHGKIWKHVK